MLFVHHIYERLYRSELESYRRLPSLLRHTFLLLEQQQNIHAVYVDIDVFAP